MTHKRFSCGSIARVALAFCLITLCLTAPKLVVQVHGQGQATSATLSGTVLDKTGAAVGGATVTLNGADVQFTRV